MTEKAIVVLLFFLFNFLPNLTFAGSTDTDAGKSVTVAPQGYVMSIPKTVSAKAAEVYGRYNALGKKIFDGVPIVDDPSVWLTYQQTTLKKSLFLLEGPIKKLKEKYKPIVIETNIASIPVIEVIPDGIQHQDIVLVYLHGGGYVANSAHTNIIAVIPLADKIKAKVIAVDYTLAPSADFNQVTDEVVLVLKSLKKQYGMKNIGIYGDSAGGGLTFATCLKLKALGHELPAALATLSPWFDLAMEGDSYTTLRQADALLYHQSLERCAAVYTKGDSKNPLASPVYADYSDGVWPPTYIQVGTKEMLLSDSARMLRKLRRAKIPVKFEVSEGLTHSFVAFYGDVPESQEALTDVADFFSTHLGVR